MEPWSCTVSIAPSGEVEIWAPTQAQDRARTAAATTLGIDADRVRIHTLLLGGGFGRRLGSDGIGPAVLVARAVGRPVKFFWTRETEFAAGWDRPAMMARLTAALDDTGRLSALTIRTSGPSLAMHFAGADPQGEEARATFVDWAATQNLNPVRYSLPAYRVDYSLQHNHFPTAPWRAVGATHNAYFLEAFIDEVARAAGRDPLEFRRELLADDPRGLALIEELARRAAWGRKLADGRAVGCAFFESYGSLCAQAAEVSLDDGWPRVHRFVTVLDCGSVITPDGARAQVEGSIVQALSTALHEAHTLRNGAAVERNFDTYRLLRFAETPPVIETHFLESGEPIGGVGEPPLPPVAPAVVNALHALTGRPLRSLPLSRHFKA
ncbi:MAG TPA: molybdopterin cofactor-binding domain-containing protein, partial [Steroidobacteraceae bacterium]|nr:molybdopterin cofactor-binding domain-containing protein [Steroidobacteraceae bacterium]